MPNYTLTFLFGLVYVVLRVFRYSKLGHGDLRTAASTALNRLAAGKGMVLLVNKDHEGKPLLPLRAELFVGSMESVRFSVQTFQLLAL